jgi:hypothetical protein
VSFQLSLESGKSGLISEQLAQRFDGKPALAIN